MDLAIVSDPTVVMVAANDPDDDLLTFLWSVPGATQIPDPVEHQEANGDWVSHLAIPSDWIQAGSVIEVTISDQAVPRNLVSVQWQAVVLP